MVGATGGGALLIEGEVSRAQQQVVQGIVVVVLQKVLNLPLNLECVPRECCRIYDEAADYRESRQQLAPVIVAVDERECGTV